MVSHVCACASNVYWTLFTWMMVKGWGQSTIIKGNYECTALPHGLAHRSAIHIHVFSGCWNIDDNLVGQLTTIYDVQGFFLFPQISSPTERWGLHEQLCSSFLQGLNDLHNCRWSTENSFYISFRHSKKIVSIFPLIILQQMFTVNENWPIEPSVEKSDHRHTLSWTTLYYHHYFNDCFYFYID